MDIALNICSNPIKKPEKVVQKKPEKQFKKKIFENNANGFVFTKTKPTFNKISTNNTVPEKTNRNLSTANNVQHKTNNASFKSQNNAPFKSQNNYSKPNNFKPEKPHMFPIFRPPSKEKYKNVVSFSDDEVCEETKEDVFGDKEKSLRELNVHDFMLQYLEKKGITKATAIQQKAIPQLLSGRNLMIRSETGSGKTLAYAIPIVHALSSIKPKISRTDGVQVLVIVPTRELALQTLEVFKDLVYSYCWLVPGQVSGGENRKAEKIRLRKGLNILIGTPGRLMDHFLHSTNMKLDNIRCLVIDEADSLVEMGHKEDVKKLVNMIEEKRNNTYDPMALLKGNIPKIKENSSIPMPLMDKNSKRMQTIFLSATLSKKVEELKDLVLKDHTSIESDTPQIEASETVNVTAPNIKQKYIITDVKTRLVVLSSLLVKKINTENCKIFIFMDTKQMVDFHEALFRKCLIGPEAKKFDEIDDDKEDADSDAENEVCDVGIFKIHGDMEQKDRTKTYRSFKDSKKGILICTDAAARGIDVPNCDYVIQYTAPLQTNIYLHRIGRTARAGRAGESILFLTEEEMEYISFIKKQHNVNIDRIMEEDVLGCLVDYMEHLRPHNMRAAAQSLQKRFEECLENDKNLFMLACTAYLSWYRYYRMFPNIQRKFFDAKRIHLGHYITSFAMRCNLGQIHKTVKKDKDTDPNKPDKKINFKLSNNPEEEKKVYPKTPKKRSRAKDLMLSEYDSGISTKKKKTKEI